MNVTLLYFLLLIPLSGFIAWLGDRIGHKSGKRRHTVFGLRPRHTAMLFTVGTGFCIALFSFATFWILSESFRTVLREGASLVLKNHELKQENQTLQAGNESLRRRTDQLNADEARETEEAKAADRKRDEADKRRDEALGRLKAVQAQETQAQAQASEARMQLAKETAELRARQDDLAGAKRDLTDLKKQLGQRAVELKTAQSRVDAAEKRVSDAELRVDDAQANVRKAEANLAGERKLADQLQTKLTDLRRQFDDQTRQYEEQSKQIAAEKKELDTLQAQLAAGQQELTNIRTSVGALRGKQITYQIGEEVSRREIKPGYSVFRIEYILRDFLVTMGAQAEQRGAGRLKSGGDDRAVIILPKLVSDTGDSTASSDEPRVVTEDDSIRAAAEAIRLRNTDVVVIATATANAVAGEPVPVDFHLYTNPIVIAADTKLGEVAINGSGSRLAIENALYAFLHATVRRSLLTAGIIPVARGGGEGIAASAETGKGGDPRRAAPPPDESETASLISLSSDDWLQIMDHVRDAGAHARVVAYAARDMRAGDPVTLRFEVKGLFGGTQSTLLNTSSY